MERILLVEDADSLREVLATVLENEGYRVDAVACAEDGLRKLKEGVYACVLADFKLPHKNGIDLLRETRIISKHVPFLLMTAYGSINIAVEAMKEGANDFICKPFEPPCLCQVVRDVIKHQRIIDRNAGLRMRRERSFLTKNPPMERLLAQAKKTARVDSSVLLLGESGTGKELIARMIHEHSGRAKEPFVAVNCAAMPVDLLESEFFGHEAGAFTGATQTRIGVFELAAKGTIFLDEVGDMPPALQVKLLRALQEREIKRVGGTKTIKAGPRVIAATNRNIDDALAAGKIRDDFYYRLAVICFTIAPLRERREDIDLLANYFVECLCASMGRDNPVIDAAARELLHTYPWPGNARELENVIERALVLADDAIKPEHLGISLETAITAVHEVSYTLPQIATLAARKAEIEMIAKALEQTGGNKSKAAEILGVSYKTLLNKVREYHLGAEQGTEAGKLID